MFYYFAVNKNKLMEYKEFLQTKINKCYNESCFDTIDKMPNGCLDLVIVDPPYGDGIGYGRNGKEILNNESRKD